MKLKNSFILSPHIQIYRFPLPAVLSIVHRVSGAVLFVLFLLFMLAVVLSSFAPQILDSIAFTKVVGLWSVLGSLSLIPILYHMFNGIRHLFWDIGIGLNIKSLYFSGIFMLIAVFTIVFWRLIS